ncbi:MAG: hypothetical protein Q7S16_02630 [bacterium]|nr:hypothetical protein [bacterium]
MKQNSIRITPLVLALIALIFFTRFQVYAAEGMGTCTTTVKSGWNFKSAGSLVCGIGKIGSGGRSIEYFPAYLDIYLYSGTEYTHARMTKQDVESGRGTRSLESALEKYTSTRIKKITNNQFDSYKNYTEDAEKNIEQNNTGKIEEYAGRLAREIFTSVWVYNPAREFTLTDTSQYKSSSALMWAANVLFGDVSDSEYTQLVQYVQDDVIGELLGDANRHPGMFSFIKNLFSGNIAIDKGWNFLSYSKVLKDENGVMSFGNGNCSITKAYVFDNESKKWIQAATAPRSMLGAGMVVYNSGAPCTLIIKNSIISTFRNFLNDGSENAPPQLPE